MNMGHILALDHWYSSIETFLMVARTGNHAVGTIKTNSLGLPGEGKFPKTGNGKRERGTLQQMSRFYNGIKLYFVAWMDKKPVHLLSTIGTSVTTCVRQIKNGRRAGAGWTRQDVIQPSIIQVYNKFMGGTDNFDWQISSFRPKIKTTSWVPKVIIHILN